MKAVYPVSVTLHGLTEEVVLSHPTYRQLLALLFSTVAEVPPFLLPWLPRAPPPQPLHPSPTPTSPHHPPPYTPHPSTYPAPCPGCEAAPSNLNPSTTTTTIRLNSTAASKALCFPLTTYPCPPHPFNHSPPPPTAYPALCPGCEAAAHSPPPLSSTVLPPNYLSIPSPTHLPPSSTCSSTVPWW